MAERHHVVDRVWIIRRGRFWSADFWHAGQHRRRSLKTTDKRVAMSAALRLAEELRVGSYAAPRQRERIAIQEAIDRYIADLESRSRAAGTVTRYRGELSRFAKFAAEQNLEWLHQLERRHGEAYRRKRTDECHATTLAHELTVVKQLLRWSAAEELIQVNPFERLRVEKPRQDPRGGPSLTQMERILSLLQAEGQLHDVVATLFFTGMRAGELQRLRVEDVDLAGNWVHVISRVGAETKTRQSRKIPVHARLRSVLERILGGCGKGRIYLFEHEGKHAVGRHLAIDANKRNDTYVSLLQRNGLPAGRADRGFTFHSCRHTFEAAAVHEHIPQRVIDSWLGHRSDASMASRYYRLGDEESQAFMKQFRFVPLMTVFPSADDLRSQAG